MKRNISKTKKLAAAQYVVCLKNEDCPASLELRKIYQLLRDFPARKLGMLRMVDESGDDYLYPADHFVAIKLTPSVERALRSAS
jgi:hypothetical protein